MRARLWAIALATLASLAFFASTGASAQGVPLFAVLNGANECNGAASPTCKTGDPNAFGSATILFPAANRVCFGITVDNLGSVNAAHIHTGAATVNGGILVSLSPASPLAGNPNAWAGCVAAAAGTVTAIKANPTGFYVNVHTTGPGGFPNGAIRGQLF
jgi:hypothetical protein